jgi:hypothetical protein
MLGKEGEHFLCFLTKFNTIQFLVRKKTLGPGIVAHTCYPNISEAEAEEPMLHNKTLSQKTNNKKTKVSNWSYKKSKYMLFT